LIGLSKEPYQEDSATPSKRGAKGRRELKNLGCSINFEGFSRSKRGGLYQFYEVLGCIVGVFSCSCGGSRGGGGGFVVGFDLGFCAFFLFSLLRCSFCILPVYLGALHACFLIKFDLIKKILFNHYPMPTWPFNHSYFN
jgi:hypothetical protein